MGHAVDVDRVFKEYASQREVVKALRGVSLTIGSGEFVTIMGASGSGKSTLLHLIGALDTPTGGTIRVAGLDIGAMSDAERTRFRRRHIGVVFQAFNLLPTLTALENVELPLLLDGRTSRDAARRAAELLELVQLSHRLRHRPAALSGGEQQRVAIARAMMNDPTLLLADEPTGNLDSRRGQELWRLLRRLADEQGRTIVTVTHEAAGAAFADRVIAIKDGTIVGEFGPEGEGHAAGVAARYSQLVE